MLFVDALNLSKMNAESMCTTLYLSYLHLPWFKNKKNKKGKLLLVVKYIVFDSDDCIVNG